MNEQEQAQQFVDYLDAPTSAAETSTPVVVEGRWAHSADLMHLTTALAKALLEIENPVKDRTAQVRSEKGNYSYAYSDLATVLDAIRKPLAKQGLVLVQHPKTIYNEDGAWLEIETVLMHASGQWMSNALAARLPDAKVQTLGGLITYLRRYAVQGMVSIASEQDDDASAPQGLAEHTQTTPTPKVASRPISQAQAKYLLVEMSKAKVGSERLLKWYAEQYELVPKIEDITMSAFDQTLAWVHSQAGKASAQPVSATAQRRASEYGDREEE